MPDALDESTVLLQKLLKQVMKESDPVKYDQLAAEILHVLEERECLKTVLATKERFEKQKQSEFGT